jgi:uncharacterized membrane protein YfcA
MKRPKRYSTTELNARLRFIIGCTIAVVYSLSMMTILYALIFVSQPMEQAPNDAEFFKILTPAVSFTTGILSGMMMSGGRGKDSDGDGIPDKEAE